MGRFFYERASLSSDPRHCRRARYGGKEPGRTPNAAAGIAFALTGVLFVAAGCGGAEERPFRTGLEVLARDGFSALLGRRVAVLSNPTGVDRRLRSAAELIAEAPGVELTALLAPEHGAFGSAEAGEAVGDTVHPRLRVPVASLYGRTRRPDRAMLHGADTIVFDIQDIGVRTYTYLSTLLEVLRAAAELGVEVWVLDRPVPIGGDVVEGPVLEPEYRSFVGALEVPLRHGLTAGEFARLALQELGIRAALRVVSMEGYRRDMPFEACGLVWVAPSPNIPTLETAFAYAGMVLVEGTNLSEGRGTTRPFRLVGAPWVDGAALAARLRAEGLPGVLFAEAWFTPAAGKYGGELCRGVELHVTDPKAFRPVAAAVALLCHARELHAKRFAFRAEAFDRLAGTARLREAIEAGRSWREIVSSWGPALDAYRRRRKAVLLYP